MLRHMQNKDRINKSRQQKRKILQKYERIQSNQKHVAELKDEIEINGTFWKSKHDGILSNNQIFKAASKSITSKKKCKTSNKKILLVGPIQIFITIKLP